VCLGDELPARTVIALCLSIASIVLVFVPRALQLLGAGEGSGGLQPAVQPHDTLLGDMLAIGTGVAQAASISVSRHAALRVSVEPGAPSPVLLSTGLSSACAFAVALSLPCDTTEAAQLGEVPGFWACTPKVFTSAAFLLYAVLDGTCVACTYVASFSAPRYITGSEVALILLLEDITGPLWVYCRFGDVPSAWTMAGGALLLTTLVGHELAGWRRKDASASIQPAVESEQSYHRLDGSVLIM